jgi:hypothetical protein
MMPHHTPIWMETAIRILIARKFAEFTQNSQEKMLPAIVLHHLIGPYKISC